MWFRKKHSRNRRLHRQPVLDVKLRSDQVRATRRRVLWYGFMAVAGPFAGLCLLWYAGKVALELLVYRNADFAIQQVEVRTDGGLTSEQLCQWAGVHPGLNLMALDLMKVKRNLERVPVLDSISVERVLPRTLKIQVTERVPVAQVLAPRSDGVLTAYQLAVDGMVMPPLNPRTRSLPLITGLDLAQLQLGRRVEQPRVLAALQLVAAFGRSPMAGLVDLRRVDVAAPGVVTVTTGQGSVVTFGLDNMDRQLRRWRQIFDLSVSRQRAIETIDLAVDNNVPVRWTAPVAPVAPVVEPPARR